MYRWCRRSYSTNLFHISFMSLCIICLLKELMVIFIFYCISLCSTQFLSTQYSTIYNIQLYILCIIECKRDEANLFVGAYEIDVRFIIIISIIIFVFCISFSINSRLDSSCIADWSWRNVSPPHPSEIEL